MDSNSTENIEALTNESFSAGAFMEKWFDDSSCVFGRADTSQFEDTDHHAVFFQNSPIETTVQLEDNSDVNKNAAGQNSQMRGGWGFKNHEESDGKAVAMETEQGYNGGANAGSSSDSDVSWNNSSPGSPVDCGEVSPGGYSSGVDLGTVSSCSSPGGSAGSGDTTGAGRRINLMLRFNLPMAFWDDSGENLSMENNTSSSPVSSKESLSRSVSEPNIVHSSSGNDSGNDGSVESFERSFLRKKSLASKIQARLSQAEARPALISRFVFADEDIEKVKKRVRVVKSLNFYEHVRPAIDGSPDQNRRMYMDISMDESGQY